MPFLNLDNNWSSLAQYYNQEKLPPSGKDFLNRPTVPAKVNQYVSFDDGFIRGGFLNAALATAQDIVRVGKFITGLSNISKASDIKDTTLQTATKGVLFLTKQLGLQQSNPRLEWQKNPDTIAPLLGGATRQFTGAGVLASIGGSAFGLHFDRAGLLGTIRDDQKYGGDINSTTSGVVWQNNFGTGLDSNRKISKNSNNRLVRYLAKIAPSLQSVPVTSTNPPPNTMGPVQPYVIGEKIVDEDGNKSNDSKTLDRYSGGSNSVYGLGITTIRTFRDSKTTIELSDYGFGGIGGKDELVKKLNGFEPTFNSTLTQAATANVGTKDFPTEKLETTLSNSLRYWNSEISGLNIEKRIGVSGPNRVDAINVIDITDSNTFFVSASGAKTPNISVGDNKEILGSYGRDIIKFRIEFLNNDSPIASNDINTDVLAFRAYLDDFSDGMNAKWNSYRYMGRGEDFYVYEGFTRDISVSFTMFAHSPEEMKPLYKKLNYLMSTFAPDYNANKMRGNIAYLTVGDYLFRQPGVFTDIKLSGMLESHWEIALASPEGDVNDMKQYEVPKMIKVGLSFKPIHTFLPRKTNKGNTINAPFITPDKVAYKNYTGGTNKYLD